jgi:hypothetical protein
MTKRGAVKTSEGPKGLQTLRARHPADLRPGKSPELPASLSDGSAPGDRGNEGHGFARLDHSVETVEKSNVFVGHEDVYESSKRAVVVQHAPGQSGMPLFHGPNRLAHRRRFDRDLSGATDQ